MSTQPEPKTAPVKLPRRRCCGKCKFFRPDPFKEQYPDDEYGDECAHRFGLTFVRPDRRACRLFEEGK